MAAAESPDQAGQLPGFVGIGALKAGTTYLDAMLRSHPQVCMAPAKEIQYFTRNYDRGLQWYARQFRGCSGRVAGEISPQYLMDAAVPQRIQDALPEARLFVSVRDPVQRLQSHYKHAVAHDGFKGSFEQFVAGDQVVRRSCYATLLRPYLAVFDLSRLHVLVFEELVADPPVHLADLYRFLGLDDRYVPAGLAEPVNVSALPRMRRVWAGAKATSRWLRQHGAHRVVEAIKPAGRRLFATGEPTTWSFELPAEVDTRLLDTFAPEVEELSALLGKDLTTWWPTAARIAEAP